MKRRSFLKWLSAVPAAPVAAKAAEHLPKIEEPVFNTVEEGFPIDATVHQEVWATAAVPTYPVSLKSYRIEQSTNRFMKQQRLHAVYFGKPDFKIGDEVELKLPNQIFRGTVIEFDIALTGYHMIETTVLVTSQV